MALGRRLNLGDYDDGGRYCAAAATGPRAQKCSRYLYVFLLCLCYGYDLGCFHLGFGHPVGWCRQCGYIDLWRGVVVPGWLHVVVGGIKFYHFVLCHSALFFLTESFSNTFGSKKGGRRFLDVLPDGRIACTTPDPDASGRRRAPRYLVGYVEGGRDSVANARRAGTHSLCRQAA